MLQNNYNISVTLNQAALLAQLAVRQSRNMKVVSSTLTQGNYFHNKHNTNLTIEKAML